MENLNQQIICALARLQEDMQSVLERLHTLEALTAVQVTNPHLYQIKIENRFNLKFNIIHLSCATSQARSLALPSDYLSPPVNKTKKVESLQ